MINAILLGKPGMGKTELLKRYILEMREDVKIIISQFDEYQEEVEYLKNNGYEVTKLINPIFIGYEQVEIDFEVKKGEILYIVHEASHADDLTAGFAKELIEGIYKQIRYKELKARIYIDNHLLFFNQVGSICGASAAYCPIVSMIQTKDGVSKNVLNQFHIVELENYDIDKFDNSVSERIAKILYARVSESGKWIVKRVEEEEQHMSIVSTKNPKGIYIGETSEQKEFYFDPFKIKGSPNNVLILGKSGSGKTEFLKKMERGLVEKGYYFRGVGGASEYRDIVLAQGGKIVDLLGKNGKVNPLEIFATQICSENKHSVDEYGSFMRHLSKIENMIRLVNAQISKIELNMEFREVLIQFYIHTGLLASDYREHPEKIKVTGYASEEYPTLSDLKEYLSLERLISTSRTGKNGFPHDRERARKSYQADCFYNVIDEVIKQYGTLFDGHTTTIENLENEQVVFFEIDEYSQLSEEIFNCLVLTALTLTWDHAVKNSIEMSRLLEEGEINSQELRHFMILMEECQRVINENDLITEKFVIPFLRETRRLGAGMFFSTSSLGRMLSKTASNQSNSVIKMFFESISNIVLLHMNQFNVDRLKEIMRESLTESEYNNLPYFYTGDAIIRTPVDKTFVKIDIENDKYGIKG